MIKKTPLFEAHNKLEGKVVEFAGYYLPIQYPTGIVAEHNAVRHNAGLFDVSHMGEFEISGKRAKEFINFLVTNEMSDIKEGQCRYTLMLNDAGGIIDDFIVYCINQEKFWLVVNASNRDKDAEWINSHLFSQVKFVDASNDYGQLALQGPKAQEILKKLTDTFPQEAYTFVDNVKLVGAKCVISRTGYTGEDGFEIYVPEKYTEKLFFKLLELGKDDGLLACGLGCRDTLRFEAYMPLYGHELGEDYLATEVGLNFFIKMDKDFIGKASLQAFAPKYKRKGVKLIDRGIAREHFPVFSDDKQIGFVTTGTMSPTLNSAIAMVRIDKDYNQPYCYIEVRGKKLKAEFVKTPFYKRQVII
ncbi:MAG: glycine cleavage system aminomethyltransferase GcvT [Clostridia bacterium]